MAEVVEDSYLDKLNGDKKVCTEQDKLRVAKSGRKITTMQGFELM